MAYVKKMNKKLYTILKNIEIICFINFDKVDKYKTFLIENISKKEKYKKLCSYLKNYYFIKINNIYNFSNFIKKYGNDFKYMNKIYLTNNIVETIHCKLIRQFKVLIILRNHFYINRKRKIEYRI